MSKKTMKQRIALVAASALTAGFLSVVSAPAANAAASTISAAASSKGLLAAATAGTVAFQSNGWTATGEWVMDAYTCDAQKEYCLNCCGCEDHDTEEEGLWYV